MRQRKLLNSKRPKGSKPIPGDCYITSVFPITIYHLHHQEHSTHTHPLAPPTHRFITVVHRPGYGFCFQGALVPTYVNIWKCWTFKPHIFGRNSYTLLPFFACGRATSDPPFPIQLDYMFAFCGAFSAFLGGRFNLEGQDLPQPLLIQKVSQV